MDRRQFASRIAWSAVGGLPIVRAAAYSDTAQKKLGPSAPDRWGDIEASVHGRLGVAMLDTATGQIRGHRLDERFPMCSTFKVLAAALVLSRVDAGRERLDRRIVVTRESLLPYAPVAAKHVGGDGMSVADLCEAAITVSDNNSANLLLASAGGPPALTRFARALGDGMTRLDRNEPDLNEATPGDPRDTSTPRAMSATLRALALGSALSDASRGRLVQWMTATSTGGKRLRAGLPADWRVADKTGTGALGTTNDVAIAWPPNRAPFVVVAYLTECRAPAPEREAALAEVARRLVARPWTPAS